MNLDAKSVAERIGIPLEHWPGQCYGISCALLRHGVVEGSVRYGHFLGRVSPRCTRFSHEAAFQRHGWIELSDNETVVDPTRWVFADVDPYIYVGPKGKEYDVGGNQWREAMLRPCPEYHPAKKRASLSIWKFDQDAHRFVMDVLFEGAPGITDEMAFWLANLPLQGLKNHATAIYLALIEAGYKMTIPIDNLHFVLPREAPAL